MARQRCCVRGTPARGLVRLGLLTLFCIITCRAAPKTRGYCQFPEFLWEPLTSGADRLWLTEPHYGEDGVNTNWTSITEVVVKPTEMVFKVTSQTRCTDLSSNESVPCYKRNVLRRLICLSEEPDSVFRVQIRYKGLTVFTCLRFVSRGKNIAQVWSARERNVNEDSLCFEKNMQRDPWPWIVSQRDDWVFCPLVGGYDFRAHLNGRKRKVCHHQWRPSRVESECVHGEAMHFYFPDARCSLFQGSPTDLSLYCWGGWEEGGFIHVVMGAQGAYPKYAMRIHKAMDETKQVSALLFFSPVTPMRRRELPRGVLMAEMKLVKSDPGVCYDESEKCEDFARQGKCTNTALHVYANFCKKSCGLCGYMADLIPSVRSECQFPEEYRSDWLLYESDRQEDVSVGAGQVSFSVLGTFICKSKHWEKNIYKMFSYYTNGCRPRYTCMRFRRDDRILRFHISHSALSDLSFDICKFEDDPLPLGNKFRSKELKILLPKSHTLFNRCGLHGTAKVNASFASGANCYGQVSDWDPERCRGQSALGLSLYPCPQSNWEDYRCAAYVALDADRSVLITETITSHSRNYQCWVINKNTASHVQGPWRQALLLDKAQCGMTSDFRLGARTSYVMALEPYDGYVSQKCHNREWISGQMSSTSRSVNPLSHVSNNVTDMRGKNSPFPNTTVRMRTGMSPPVVINPTISTGWADVPSASDRNRKYIYEVIANGGQKISQGGQNSPALTQRASVMAGVGNGTVPLDSDGAWFRWVIVAQVVLRVLGRMFT